MKKQKTSLPAGPMRAKKTTKRQTEDRIYEEQYTKIAKRFGEEVARASNFGWGVSATKEYLSIATKAGAWVLTSTASAPDWAIDHEWQKY